ncbi:laminin domain protein [Ceratobasidium sp. AG-Ba]|nr:laminin domain protein [Ceratobasidium sp. AG-Ba]
MNLSQHLFGIQFGRYLQKATNREYDAKVSKPTDPAISGGYSRSAHDLGRGPTADVQNQGHHYEPVTPDAPPTDPLPEILLLQTEIASLHSEISTLKALPEEHYLKAGMDDAKALLARLCDGTEDIQQTLVGAQNCMVRGANSAFRGEYLTYSYSLINAKGETPESVGLPSTASLEMHMLDWVENRDHDLARHLRFYGIGEEVIEQGA